MALIEPNKVYVDKKGYILVTTKEHKDLVEIKNVSCISYICKVDDIMRIVIEAPAMNPNIYEEV